MPPPDAWFRLVLRLPWLCLRQWTGCSAELTVFSLPHLVPKRCHTSPALSAVLWGVPKMSLRSLVNRPSLYLDNFWGLSTCKSRCKSFVTGHSLSVHLLPQPSAATCGWTCCKLLPQNSVSWSVWWAKPEGDLSRNRSPSFRAVVCCVNMRTILSVHSYRHFRQQFV